MLNTNEKELNKQIEYFQKLFGIIPEDSSNNDDCETSSTHEKKNK